MEKGEAKSHGSRQRSEWTLNWKKKIYKKTSSENLLLIEELQNYCVKLK